MTYVWKCKRTLQSQRTLTSPPIPHPVHNHNDKKNTQNRKNGDSTRPLNSVDTKNIYRAGLACSSRLGSELCGNPAPTHRAFIWLVEKHFRKHFRDQSIVRGNWLLICYQFRSVFCPSLTPNISTTRELIEETNSDSIVFFWGLMRPTSTFNLQFMALALNLW